MNIPHSLSEANALITIQKKASRNSCTSRHNLKGLGKTLGNEIQKNQTCRLKE
jgi:hypothetical protein